MIRKRKWLISLICLMGLILMACGSGGSMASEEIDLQHLITPGRLMVQSKEVYEMVQEISNSGPGVVDDLSQLEDEELQEVETFFGQLPKRMLEIEERTIEIRDEATIESIFDKLRTVSGIVCDGAKSSCAAKIASSVDAAMMAHHLAMKNIVFEQGAGIVKKNVEKTISAVGRLGREGMRETDVEVLKIMMED